MRFGLRFSFDGGKELRSHHLSRALNHSLAYACDCSTDLHIAFIIYYRRAVNLFEIKVAGTL